MRFLIICLFTILQLSVYAQVVETNPIFPNENSTVTIIFHADRGNKALENCNCVVYAHAGVVTSASATNTSWRHVIGNWATDDSRVKMTSLGNNRYSLTYNIRSFHNVPSNETVLRLAFVFRNVNGSLVGRSESGSDIFLDLYDANAGLLAVMSSPSQNGFLAQEATEIPVRAFASVSAKLELFQDDNLILSLADATELTYDLESGASGNHEIRFVATLGADTITETRQYVVPRESQVLEVPSGTKLGINHISDTHLRLMLEAPGKQQVFVKGTFSDWKLDADYQMNISPDERYFWMDFENLTAGQAYTYQYVVDGTLTVADPLSETILDPNADNSIPAITYPNRPPYPQGASGIVTLVVPGEEKYEWVTNDFERPKQGELVIYELLLRDFIARHDYKTLLDTLDYLERLGVNAIQLMPVNEFENNNSWGYNPSFHMALDKYYGTKNDFKAFIDEAHNRGIAIILDVVYNHAFGQSPLCQLYWDAANNRPSPDNPWVNPVEKHPFNVGYDINHESQATKDWLDRVMLYWMEEFKIDGFRFDLSKGFTQTQYNNADAWSKYDAGRIALWKRIYHVIKDVAPDFYIILEHFAENSEEKELAEYGMMLWGNLTHQYNESTMGYPSDLRWGVYRERTWTQPNLVTYMESHDEERLMYKNLQFGNASGNYSTKNPDTALERVALASAFFYTLPGAKMLWQFGEVGYDFSINHCENGTINPDCRTSPKPIRWNYTTQENRRALYYTTMDLIHIKKLLDSSTPPVFDYSLTTMPKRVRVSTEDLKIIVLGNFNVQSNNIQSNFYHEGWWHDYFSGDSIQVTDTAQTFSYAPGEYHLYTDRKIEKPSSAFTTSTQNAFVQEGNFRMYPNPGDGTGFILSGSYIGSVNLQIRNLNGNVLSSQRLDMVPGDHQINIPTDLPSGMYLVYIMDQSGRQFEVKKWMVQH